MSLGQAAIFLLIAVLAGAVFWHKRRRLPFWARVVLTLLGALGMFLTLLRAYPGRACRQVMMASAKWSSAR